MTLAAGFGLGAPADSPSVTVTYVANAGFLVSADEAKVLIDACHSGGLDEYESPGPTLLRSIEDATGPFDGVDLVLSSHRHVDHFDAATVASHLLSNEQAHFVSASEMTEAVASALTRLGADESVSRRVRRVGYRLSPHRESAAFGPISVQAFRLDHGGYPRPRYRLQNLGHVIDIAGIRLLHVGDADMTLQNFYGYALHRDPVDVAFIPFWYLKDPVGRKIVRDLIAPRMLVAMHVPPDSWEREVSEIREHFPEVLVFPKSMQSADLDRSEN